MDLLVTTIQITTIHIRVHPTLATMFQVVGINCDWVDLINLNLQKKIGSYDLAMMRSF